MKPIIFIKFILFGKIDIKYVIRVSEFNPPPNFTLRSKKFIKPKTKNDKTLGSSCDVMNFYYGFGDTLGHSCFLPSFLLIDAQTVEVRRGSGILSSPYLLDFQNPVPFGVKGCWFAGGRYWNLILVYYNVPSSEIQADIFESWKYLTSL